MAIVNITGLWKKTKGVSTYYSGSVLTVDELLQRIGSGVSEFRFGLFTVKNKKGENSPDISLVIFTDDKKQVPPPAEKKDADYYPPPPEDDIPF